MATVLWDNAELCDFEDIKGDVGLATVSQTTKTPQDAKAFVEECIEQAKGEIKTKLLARLPDIYARSGLTGYSSFDAYVTAQGYTYADLDTVYDKFTNPTVLNLSCRALTCMKIYSRVISHNQANYKQDNAQDINERDFWDMKFKEHFRDEWQLLKLDLNDDGETTDFERPRTRNNFQRV
jgi:GTP cyclohydrolase III